MMRLTRSGTTRLAQETAGTVLASVSSPGELHSLRPVIENVPAGARLQVVVEGFGLGALASLPGVEVAWNAAMPSGIEVSNISRRGFSTAVIDLKTNSSIVAQQGQDIDLELLPFVIPVVILLVAIAVVLSALGWAIGKITVLLFGKGGGGAFNFAAIAGIAVVGVFAFSQFRGRSP